MAFDLNSSCAMYVKYIANLVEGSWLPRCAYVTNLSYKDNKGNIGRTIIGLKSYVGESLDSL